MAHLGYTNDDFLNLIIIYGECNRIVSRTCRVFAERYPEKPRPNHKTVKRLLNNCSQFGQFKSKRNKPKTHVDNEDLQLDILGYFAAHPNSSLRECEQLLQVSTRTIHRI